VFFLDDGADYVRDRGGIRIFSSRREVRTTARSFQGGRAGRPASRGSDRSGPRFHLGTALLENTWVEPERRGLFFTRHEPAAQSLYTL
jgi:hypothetical protein